MKKKIITFALALILTVSLTACIDEEDSTPQTPVQRTIERFDDIDKELIINFFAACESIELPEDSIQVTYITPSDDNSSFNVEFWYEGYVFNATATADYNITDIVCGSLYFVQNGEILSDVSCIPTSMQFATLQSQSEEDVKKNLISPATAEFPRHILNTSQWKIARDDNIFTVASWVDSQNKYGALIRYTFIATYEWDGTDDTKPVLTDIEISE